MNGVMRFTIVRLFFLVVCIAPPALAEVEFTAKLLHQDVLVCEPAPIIVTIRNDLAAPLIFGGENGAYIGFDVYKADGLLLHPRNNAQIVMPAVVQPGETVAVTNDLQALFPLSGHTMLSVRARLVLGNRTFATEKMHFDIVPGLEVMRIQARAPDGGRRTYSLRTLNRNKRDRLLLRADNEDGTLCFGVSDLGRFVRMGKPALEVDAAGNVHVLHLTAPNQFAHTILTPDAIRISRTVVEGDVNGVKLVPDGNGGYRVAGAGRVSPPRDTVVEPLPLRRGL